MGSFSSFSTGPSREGHHQLTVPPSSLTLEAGLLAPAPRPTYTLAPGLAAPSGDLALLLDLTLARLTGRLGGVVVTQARTTGAQHVLELDTRLGAILVLERAGRTAG